MRTSQICRKTNETKINININVDGSGENRIETGIGFLNHMLTQIAFHGLIDLEILAVGDLEVDEHHTVEDVGLALGEAFFQALGEKRGIERIGQACVPMDEALCQVVLDLSGRPYLVFDADWSDTRVANLPVSLIEHFFYSLAMTSKATIHAKVCYGSDNHHICEALFTAFGRALRRATSIDPRRSDHIPSSKGVL